jgi:hypothetical protein
MVCGAIGEYCVQHAEKSAAARDTAIKNQDYRSDNVPTTPKNEFAHVDRILVGMSWRQGERCGVNLRDTCRCGSWWGTREIIALGSVMLQHGKNRQLVRDE